jgi:hypothetical protein
MTKKRSRKKTIPKKAQDAVVDAVVGIVEGELNKDEPKEDRSEPATVIGYGTFISRGFYVGKKNVRVVTIKGFRRVFNEKMAWFPFALPEKDSSFKAIAFDIDPKEFRNMDGYESCGRDPLSPMNALYFRAQVDAIEKDGSSFKAWMYVAGDRSYEQIKQKCKFDLSPEVDKDDKWLSELKRDSEIHAKFPELFV